MTTTSRFILLLAACGVLAAAAAGGATADEAAPGREAAAHERHDDDAHDDHHDEPAFSVEDFQRHGVSLATAASGVVDAGLALPAEVRPNADRLAHVAPRFPGIVREVRKTVGDTVRAGEVLALVESDTLATYELKAGFAGTVIDKHITPGEAVDRDEPAYVIADLSTVWVDVSVHQKAIPQVQVGQAVVVATSDGTLEAAGTVSYLAPIVDQATRTATARVVLANPEGRWRPGLFAIATLANPVDAAVVVPRVALHRLEGRAVVFVAGEDGFVPRPVTVGAVGRTRAEIVAGLAAGERVAGEGSFLVKAELAKGAAGHDH